MAAIASQETRRSWESTLVCCQAMYVKKSQANTKKHGKRRLTLPQSAALRLTVTLESMKWRKWGCGNRDQRLVILHHSHPCPPVIALWKHRLIRGRGREEALSSHGIITA